MQTIEINTTQNVVIEYELSDLKDRVLAFIIDAFILYISIMLLSALYHGIFEGGSEYFYYFVLIPVFVFYSPIMEYFMKGQSPGKKAMNIKVVKLTGEEADVTAYLAR